MSAPSLSICFHIPNVELGSEGPSLPPTNHKKKKKGTRTRNLLHKSTNLEIKSKCGDFTTFSDIKEKNKKHQSKRQIKIGVGDEANRVVTRAKEKNERHKVGRENCGPFFSGF
jgi:hypothetical protein